jgi:hypothetical protein
LLGDGRRLSGTFRIGTAESAVMPPWLAGELVQVMGPAVVRGALAEARAREKRPNAQAYYDAFEAEAALAAGRPGEAVALATRALEGLVHSEVLLRARAMVIAAEAERRQGRLAQASAHWHRAFDADPGAMRRMGLPLPVRIAGGGGAAERTVASALERSPRLRVGDGGFTVQVDVDAGGGRVCLLGEGRQVLGCGEARVQAGDDADAVAARLVQAFHEEVFAPRVDMSQADIHSLDGSHRVSRDPLRTLFDDDSAADVVGDDP